jgi:hypothetical protein
VSPDEQQAESLKYSNRVAIILQLESGAWALFNNQRRLITITNSFETLALSIATISSSVIEAGPVNLLTDLDLDSLLDDL